MYKSINRDIKTIPRDAKGRFTFWSGTEWAKEKKRVYTISDIKEAFIAGLNAQGGIMPPSKKADIYLSKFK